MTVKDLVGRVRYVAFRVARGGSLSRPVLAAALPSEAKLTRFDGTYGIVKTGHASAGSVRAALSAIALVEGREVRVETLATSGTIRGAATALPARSPAARRSPPPGRGGGAKRRETQDRLK